MNIATGGVFVADLGQETRRLVIVVSGPRFNRATERALVAPALSPAEDDGLNGPARVDVDGHAFAIEMMATIPQSRLLEHVGDAPPLAVRTIARIMRNVSV